MYVVDIDRLGKGEDGLVGPFETRDDAEKYLKSIYGDQGYSHPGTKIRLVSRFRTYVPTPPATAEDIQKLDIALQDHGYTQEEIAKMIYIKRSEVERLKEKYGDSE